ncbi:MAG: FHA domain-containing protein [Persicimonas sp.]
MQRDFGDIDLNILRGFSERIEPSLRREHRLPALARLVGVGADRDETIHGPDVLMGRYHPQYGPVDIIPRGLRDHENYRMGAPHLHLTLEDDGWVLRTVSPGVRTLIGERVVELPNRPHRLQEGDVITTGQVRYRFETSGVSMQEWKQARAALFSEAESSEAGGPALFLCRRGGPCGPHLRLGADEPLVVGRSFPADEAFAAKKPWHGKSQPSWDLAGLYEAERKFVAFLHARLEPRDGQWQVLPMAARRKTFVNRLEIIDRTPVSSGDELALGSVLFVVHDPRDTGHSQHRSIEPPVVIDWQEGSTPILDPPDEAVGSAPNEGDDE